jgi:hypothetical protein
MAWLVLIGKAEAIQIMTEKELMEALEKEFGV